MKKISKVFTVVLVIFLISSFTMVNSFAATGSTLDLTAESYALFEYNPGLNLYFTKSNSIGIHFSAYNTLGNFSNIHYSIYKLEGFDVINSIGTQRTLVSSMDVYISQSTYEGTYQYTLPALPVYDQQGAFEIQVTATGSTGSTIKVIRVIYSEKDYAVVNIVKNIPNPYSGIFSLSANIYDLSSVGVRAVKAGIYRDNIPAMYFSRDVNYYYNSNNKYTLTCTLSTDTWNDLPGLYWNCFRVLKNNSNVYQEINGDSFIIP